MRKAAPLVCLFALLAGAVTARAASDTQVNLDATGILLFERDAPEVAAWLNVVGVDSVRIQVPWGRLVEKGNSLRKPAGFNDANNRDRHYHWGGLDRAVKLVRLNGMRPVLTLNQYGPLWASQDPKRHNPAWMPDPKRFGAFAAAVATRYRKDVDIYLLGNEANQRLFLSPQLLCTRPGRCQEVAPHIYRALVRAAYPKIKRADPSAKVILGELAPIGGAARSEKTSLKPLAFVRQMACVDRNFRPIRTGLCRNFVPAKGDGFGYHPYARRERPDQATPDRDAPKFGDLPRLLSTLDKLTARGRLRASTGKFNLYLTEYGYETNPPDPKNGVSLALQAQYLQQSYYLAWANPRVKLINQYLWRDGPLSGPGGSRYGGFQTGLLFRNNTPKPSRSVFQNPFFIDTKPGLGRALFWGQVRPGDVRELTLFKLMGGLPVALETLNTDSHGYWTRVRSVSSGDSYFYTYEDGVYRSAVFTIP